MAESAQSGTPPTGGDSIEVACNLALQAIDGLAIFCAGVVAKGHHVARLVAHARLIAERGLSTKVWAIDIERAAAFLPSLATPIDAMASRLQVLGCWYPSAVSAVAALCARFIDTARAFRADDDLADAVQELVRQVDEGKAISLLRAAVQQERARAQQATIATVEPNASKPLLVSYRDAVAGLPQHNLPPCPPRTLRRWTASHAVALGISRSLKPSVQMFNVDALIALHANPRRRTAQPKGKK